MATRTISISVRNGKPVISTAGFTGDSCLKATERLERDLGGDVTDHERTASEPEQKDKEYEGGY